MRALPPSPLVFACAVTLASVAAPPSSSGCFSSPDKSQELSLQIAPGVSHEVYAAYYAEEGGKGSCSASIQVSLSAFPSSRLATRPKDVAIAIRELIDVWEIENCTIQVWYDNDTGEEFAEYELCLTEDFNFDAGAFWSASAERYCWQPSDFEFSDEDLEEATEEVDEPNLQDVEMEIERIA
jgi:hypothetical protein